MRLGGSSWAFSDACNYPVSRQCLVNDRETCRSCCLWKNRPGIDQQCPWAGDVVLNVEAKLGTQPASMKKKTPVCVCVWFNCSQLYFFLSIYTLCRCYKQYIYSFWPTITRPVVLFVPFYPLCPTITIQFILSLRLLSVYLSFLSHCHQCIYSLCPTDTSFFILSFPL